MYGFTAGASMGRREIQHEIEQGGRRNLDFPERRSNNSHRPAGKDAASQRPRQLKRLDQWNSFWGLQFSYSATF
jgi:hypothetical protein